MRFFIVILTLVFAACGAAAVERPVPQGQIILTVTGDIEATNDGEAAIFDRTLLAATGWREITTHSPFLDGEQTFAGVPFLSLLRALGVEPTPEGEVRAQALDGYDVTIPMTDVLERDLLLAMEHEGRRMRIRNRGPIWVIYPMTAAEAQAGDAQARMIWQLRSMEIIN